MIMLKAYGELNINYSRLFSHFLKILPNLCVSVNAGIRGAFEWVYAAFGLQRFSRSRQCFGRFLLLQYLHNIHVGPGILVVYQTYIKRMKCVVNRALLSNGQYDLRALNVVYSRPRNDGQTAVAPWGRLHSIRSTDVNNKTPSWRWYGHHALS